MALRVLPEVLEVSQDAAHREGVLLRRGVEDVTFAEQLEHRLGAVACREVHQQMHHQRVAATNQQGLPHGAPERREVEPERASAKNELLLPLQSSAQS